jgi:hypothetical protein
MGIDSNPTSGRLLQQRTGLFISYSHKDKRWLDELNTMLKPLVRRHTIDVWDDTRLEPGTNWRKEIIKALDSAKVAVLLVTPKFLDSDFITRVELPRLLRAAKRDGLIIFWVAVKHSFYRLTAIAEYQAANDPAKPLAALRPSRRDEELLNICEKIGHAATTRVVRKSSAKKTSKAAPSSMPPRRVKSGIPSKLRQHDPTEFLIDFDDQRNLFKEMLDDPKKRLMFIQAPGGRGKSSLLLMLRSQCEHKNIPCSSIDSKEKPYDNPHFTLAREMCKQLGLLPRHLANALQPLSIYKSPGEIDDPYIISQIFAGVKITQDGLSRPMKERLRDAFIADLGQFVKDKGRVVCLFDSFERLSPGEEDWLLDTLLTPIKSGKLKDVMIVTAGHHWPKIDKRKWERKTHLIDGLPPMKAQHIKTYAEKLNIKITDEEANYYRKASAGIPLHMVMVVRNLRTQSEVA